MSYISYKWWNIGIILIIIGLVETNECTAQCPDNILKNPSFENGTSGKPDNYEQFGHCDDWKKINKHFSVTTPDWFGPLHNEIYPPAEGDYLYIGKLNKETKNQQQQIEELEKEKEDLNSLYQALEERVMKLEN